MAIVMPDFSNIVAQDIFEEKKKTTASSGYTITGFIELIFNSVFLLNFVLFCLLFCFVALFIMVYNTNLYTISLFSPMKEI